MRKLALSFLAFFFLATAAPVTARAQELAAPLAAAKPPASWNVTTETGGLMPDGLLAETTDEPQSDSRVAMWRLEMGYRASFVRSAGFDPFSTNDLLPQFSTSASRTVFSRGALSFAPGLSWDHAASGATARGDTTSLTMNRLAVPLEGRVHFVPWGYAFLRVAPGVVVLDAEVDDPSSPANLTKSRWLFATDVSAGFAWLVWPPQRRAGHAPRLWLQADGGYGWVASERLDLSPALASGDARVVSGVDLGSVTMSGAFFRIAAAVSF